MDRGGPGPEVPRPAGGHHQGRPSAVSGDEQACPRRRLQDQLLRRSVQDDGEHQQVRSLIFQLSRVYRISQLDIQYLQ